MLTKRDKACIWHPYTQMGNKQDPIVIVRGQGASLFTEDGRRLVDAVSSWWVNLHGHGHPYINEKLSQQLEKFEHAMFTDFTHAPAVELAERLGALAPGDQKRVFYSENGSTAVETALKIALQYWSNFNAGAMRNKILCLKNGYHGDTFGAMSASSRTHFNRPFWEHLFPSTCLDLEEDLSFCDWNQVACFIYEPLIQGANGMQIYPKERLEHILEQCQKHEVITIADEVMTGFGRTGSLFASEALKLKPSMICLSKGLTGGYLPLGATLCQEYLFEGFYSDNPLKAFLHGHSYCANPLACTAALASLDLLLDPKCVQQRSGIERRHKHFKAALRSHPRLKRCEVLGTILVLEYIEDKEDSYYSSLGQALKDFFIQRNIIVRPLGNVLYLMPPYCISDEDLNEIYACILETLQGHLC